MKYEILPHTADLKIKVFGKTKEELFSNALLAMTEALKPEITESKEPAIRDIVVKSADLETLLVDFLSEILYLVQTNKEIYPEINFKEFSDTKLKGKIFGKKIERFGEDIKAVTYHNLSVKQRRDNVWEAIIIFDI